jgi:hypothetical protein
MSLSLNELQTQLTSAGVSFIPADSNYYTDFLYKIEFSPKFTGLGGITGDRYCTIKLGNPAKALTDAAEFTNKIEKLVANIAYRQEICDFIESMPETEYKSRTGGENYLFYFRDMVTVTKVVDRYKDMINSVTGPINSAHTAVIGKNTIVLRNKLYHNKFRYYIEFTHNPEFLDNISEPLVELLNTLPQGAWRSLGLKQLIIYHKESTSGAHTFRNFAPTFRRFRPPKTVAVYFKHQDDYIYAKLLSGEYILSNHEVQLFSELDT